MESRSEERIEQLLYSLAREPVSAREEFKQRLIATLQQEQRRILRQRAERHIPGALLQGMCLWRVRCAQGWIGAALILAIFVLGLALLIRPGQRVFLTVYEGNASLTYYYPTARSSEQGQGKPIPIDEGIHIALDERSVASLKLFDSSQVELFPSTQITLAQARPRSLWQGQAVRIRLSAGEMRAKVAPLHAPYEVFEVETPVALVSVHGTVFSTRVVTPQHVHVATSEGVVAVTLTDPAQGNPRAEVPAGCEVDAVPGAPLLVRCGEEEERILTLPSEESKADGGNVASPVPNPALPGGSDGPTLTRTPSVASATTLMPSPTGTPSAAPPPAVTATAAMTGENRPRSTVTVTPSPVPQYPIPPAPTDTSSLPPRADLIIEIVDAPSLVAAEGKITYTLRVVNRGPAEAQDVVVRDFLPPQVNFDAAALAPEREGNTLLWRLGTLDAEASRSWRVSVVVLPGAIQPFTNTVTVSSLTYDNDLSNNLAVAPTAVTTAADLDLSLAGIPPLVGTGGSITCTLIYTNAGPAAARDVAIAVWLSDGLTFGGVVDDSPQPDSGVVPSGTLALGGLVPVVWRIPVLKAAASGRIAFMLSVQEGFLGPVTTTVTIAATSPDPREDNNLSTHTVMVVYPADLTVGYTIAPEPAMAGGTVTYTLFYTNNGPGIAGGVLLTMTLPAGIKVKGQLGAASALAQPTSDSRSLAWFLPSLPAGASGVLVLIVVVDQNASGPLYGRSAIRSITPESAPGDNVLTWAISPLMPALESGYELSPGTIAPLMPFTCTVYITNTGALSLPARSLSAILSFPQGFRITSVCGRCNPRPLAPGEGLGLPLTIVATGEVTPGVHLGQIVVTAATPGGLLTATEPMSVHVALPSVRVAQEADAASGQIRLTIRLTNTGPSPLDRIRLYESHVPPLVLREAFPLPDGGSAAGELEWPDLTQLPPHGLGRNLRPGETLSVTLLFEGAVPLTWLSSYVEVSDIRDVYGNISEQSFEASLAITRLYLPITTRFTAQDLGR